MANYSQAQVFPILSYANTFADLMVSTNGLVQQNNDLAANNFVKPSGTIFLGDSSLGLQVNTAAIVAGAFQVQGTGSSAYIQNAMRVDGLVNFTNTSTSLLANGQIQAYGSGTGLIVANNATVSGTLTSGTSLVTGTQTVSGTLTASANATANNVTVSNYLNTNLLYASGVSTLANAVISTQTVTTSTITTATIANENVANSNVNLLVANTLIVPVGLTATTMTANGQITSNSLSVTGSTYVNNLTANGQFSIGGNFVINGTTVYNSNTFTLNAGSSTAANSYFNVNRGSSGTNASIRWNEGGKYFDIIDVTTNTYYAITTTKTPSNITFTGSAGTSSVTSNGVVSFTSNNGVVTSGSSNTFTISTPQDLRTTAYPTFAGLTLSTPLTIANGGTGATSSGSALTNLLPSGTTTGYVLTTGGPGNFYWAAGGGGGGGGATPGTTINSTYLSYSSNGTGLTYTTPTYIPGTDQLKVYIDGIRKFPGTYTETSNTTVTFSVSPSSGTSILLEVDGYINNSYYANNIAYSVNSNISGTANTIQLAIDGLVTQVISNYTLVAYGNSAYAQANAAYTVASNAYNAANNITFSSLAPSGAIAGYVLTTGGAGSYYWASANGGGGGGTSVGTTINSTRIYPTVNASQTVFTTPTYVPGANQLRVYVNGVRQFGSEYTETSNTSVTLGNGTSSGDVVLLEVDGYINNPYYANNIAYTVNGNISSTANTIQLAIDGLTTKLTTYYANTSLATTFANNVLAATAANGTSNTMLATTAFVNNYVTGNVQSNSLGVGTAASGTTGEIRATGTVSAGYSDDRLKTKLGNIENALDKVLNLNGFYYQANETAQQLGYTTEKQVGLSAQQVLVSLPEVVVSAPISNEYLTIQYERLIPLLVEAIKEQQKQIEELKGSIK